MYHIQDQVRLFFESADLFIQLCDPDGVEVNHLLTEAAAAAEGGGLAGAVSMAASAAGRRSAGMRMTLQRAASAPAARRPARQNWAT